MFLRFERATKETTRTQRVQRLAYWFFVAKNRLCSSARAYTVRMAEQVDERLADALKALQDDETLTADLTDEDAAAVLEWLERELRSVGGTDDRRLARRAEELRRAVKQVARRYADDPAALIAAARAAATASSEQPALFSASASTTDARARPARGPRARRRRAWTP